MSQDLYSSRVLELAADIPHVGLLESPDGRSHRVSRLCGSEIEVDVCLQDGQVIAAGIEPKACALGQASASILMRHIMGTTPKAKGLPPPGVSGNYVTSKLSKNIPRATPLRF